MTATATSIAAERAPAHPDPDRLSGPGESWIRYLGRPLRLQLSRAAWRALERLEAPLEIEMELYFSCLVRKQVRFHAGDRPAPARRQFEPLALTDRLSLSFRPVVTEHCSVADAGEAPPLTDLPAVRGAALVPRWLKLDFRSGAWVGEFGY